MNMENKISRMAAVLCALVLMLSCVTFSASALSVKGYVKATTGVNMREKANTGSSRVGSLSKGTVVAWYQVTTVSGQKWYYVQNNGKYGWVLGSYLTSSTASAKTTTSTTSNSSVSSKVQGYVTTTTSVNLRAQASTKASRLASVPKGTKLAWYGTAKAGGYTWYYVLYGKQKGWVVGNYLTSSTSSASSATSTTSNSSVSSKVQGYVTTTTSVNLRAQASTKASRLASVPKGTKLAWYGTAKAGGYTWYYVLYGKQKGWVVSSYLKQASTSATSTTTTVSNSVKVVTVKDGSKSMKLYPAEKIDWYKGGIQTMIKRGCTFQIYDVKTGHIWKAYRQAGGDHMDIEPYTASDTKTLCTIYGVSKASQIASNNLWQRRPCLVTVGTHTYACSLYGVPHGTSTISNNNMDGQVCLHFTNSKTHGTKKVDSYHAAAITYALNNGPLGKK